MVVNQASALLEEFNRLLDLDFVCPPDLTRAAEKAVQAAKRSALRPKSKRRRELFALVNSKLGLNQARIRALIDFAARQKCYFNYQDKNALAYFFDGMRQEEFHAWCDGKGIGEAIRWHFQPISESETIIGLHRLLATGHVKRRDARNCTLEEKKILIQSSLFGSFIFSAFGNKEMHKIFNEEARENYYENFFDHLREYHYDQLHRECALIYYDIDLYEFKNLKYQVFSEIILTGIRESYDRLANHCYFAIRLKSTEGEEKRKWRLFSDIVLFAEKHREVMLAKGYFKPNMIQEATKNHIGKALDVCATRFDLANEGFFFKDCFVLSHAQKEGTTNDPYDILMLFEKNERDERMVPCPACRSKNVAGNSYPTLGIKSWECRNMICPERSAYDRGNRYSLSSIIRQEAITSKENQIPLKARKRWRNDVLFGVRDDEVMDMLIRHFTLHKDQVIIFSHQQNKRFYLGRKITYQPFGAWKVEKGIRRRFFESAFFKRFALKRPKKASLSFPKEECMDESVTAIHGDCESRLNTFKRDVFDGAVTSPPYYNAREYSQWPNIYCYLYDMYNAACAVFRTLKPGGLYIYNIFDYFDNENITAFSSMGKKRMILGAYIIYLFEKSGFEIAGNIIWFKGNIEGKRNFNQGNASPYYQFPFNCWEHCLVFQKPGKKAKTPIVQILKQHPVRKMIRGKNIHGHAAPFPPEIPELLINTLTEGAVVLDPYAGSMTTACVALQKGIGALMFEQDEVYFELGIHNIRNAKGLFK